MTATAVATNVAQTAVGFVVVTAALHAYNRVQDNRAAVVARRELTNMRPATSRRVVQTAN